MHVISKFHQSVCSIGGILLLLTCGGPALAQDSDGTCEPSVSVNNKPCSGGSEPHFVINNQCSCPVSVKILDSDGNTHLVHRNARESGEGSYVYTCRQKPLEIRSYAVQTNCPRKQRDSAADKVKPDKPSPWTKRAEEMKAKSADAEAKNQQNATATNQKAREIDERQKLSNERMKLEEDLRIQQERKDQIAREEAMRSECTTVIAGRPPLRCCNSQELCLTQCYAQHPGESRCASACSGNAVQAQ